MKTLTFAIVVLVAQATIASFAFAQHADIMVQDVYDRLTHGTADYLANNGDGAWILGDRTYADDFDSDFDVNDPGWTIFGTGNSNLPLIPGTTETAEGLTPNADLNYDFLPMVIDGYASNLMYWDGVGAVNFGATPTSNYTFGFENFFSAGSFSIDGSPVLGLGETVFRTDELGGFHQHRDWGLNDGVSGTDPADGIYLVAMRNHMDLLDRSRPYYVLFGTPGSATAARDAAEAWVDTQLDELAPDYSADFNGDLTVGSADLTVWETGYGTTGSASLQIVGDADFNDAITGLDFLEWQQQSGSNISNFGGATSALVSAVGAVPEPTTFVMALLAGIMLGKSRRS